MDKRWRPKGWRGFHCEELCIDCPTNPVDCNKYFEAGADKMLRGVIDYIYNQMEEGRFLNDVLKEMEDETGD